MPNLQSRSPAALFLAAAALIAACAAGAGREGEPAGSSGKAAHDAALPGSAPAATAGGPADRLAQRTAHLHEVAKASFCAECHPDAVAEHRMNTHGRAFTDEEVRLATARFSIDGCIPCHTPRPVFETGIGMNPKKRLTNLEEGNDCFSCHARKGFDFSTFVGGKAECKSAFDERVSTVEACASCHKNHGTPYQWEHAEHGALAGNTCVDCHMPKVVRPVAVGEPPRETRRHTFFASRSESQLRRAYSYSARIEDGPAGSEVVVTIENKGAGHNFPTELKQRAVESVVIVRDADGNEVVNTRQVHRDPYKRPYGLMLPVNTQIPSGGTREHRVPIPVANGTVETALYYKLYFPIEDAHPTLSRRLETRILPFHELTPSSKAVQSAPELDARLPEALPAEAASPGNLVDFARPKIGKVEVEIPDGTKDGDVARLIALFQFPVGEANRKAQDKLVELGAKAVPELVEALGSWDGKTWTQAKGVLVRMGDVGRRAVVEALSHEALYVKLHALEILPRWGDLGPDRADALARLVRGLSSEEALVRAGSAQALGALKAVETAERVRPLLEELDFDVCACAARALGAMGDKNSLPALRAAFARVKVSPETGRDLAWALAALGDDSGMSFLLDGLAHPDDLVRETFFENWLDVTGASRGYTPFLPADDRSTALADLRNWWTTAGGTGALRTARSTTIPVKLRVEVEKLVKELGGDDVHASTPARDAEIVARLGELGAAATPMILDGLKWPSGFMDKRAGLLRALAVTPDHDALAGLIDASRDPVPSVALWAVEALGALGDPSGREAAIQLGQRMAGLARWPADLGSRDSVQATIARARARMGDPAGGEVLLGLLWSPDAAARAGAETTLREVYGTPIAGEDPVATAARRTLSTLPEERARELDRLRARWERLVLEAESAGAEAKTAAERLRVLDQYDDVLRAALRYSDLDARAFGQDDERSRLGFGDVSALVAKDAAFLAALTARDALSAAERGGWSFGAARATFGADGLTVELPADAAATTIVFGADQRWRDYAIELELTIDAGAARLLERCDALGGGDGAAELASGTAVRISETVVGTTLVRSAEPALPAVSFAESAAATRSGGLGLGLAPGTKLRISKLAVRVLRASAP